MNIHDATEAAYLNGYDAGASSALDILRAKIETFLCDDTEILVSEGEIFVPIQAVRELVDKIKKNYEAC